MERVPRALLAPDCLILASVRRSLPPASPTRNGFSEKGESRTERATPPHPDILLLAGSGKRGGGGRRNCSNEPPIRWRNTTLYIERKRRRYLSFASNSLPFGWTSGGCNVLSEMSSSSQDPTRDTLQLLPAINQTQKGILITSGSESDMTD